MLLLPPAVENGLYRVAQELLSNVVRHARARTLAVAFTSDAQNATLVVEDDGQGFDPDNLREGRYGLLGLQERVRFLHGRLSLKSQPGQGTRAEVVVPIGT